VKHHELREPDPRFESVNPGRDRPECSSELALQERRHDRHESGARRWPGLRQDGRDSTAEARRERLDELRGVAAEASEPAPHRSTGGVAPRASDDLLHRLPGSPEVPGDEGRQDSEDRTARALRAAKESDRDEHGIRLRIFRSQLPLAEAVRVDAPRVAGQTAIGTVAVRILEQDLVLRHSGHALGDHRPSLDPSRHVAPRQANCRRRRRERYGAHGYSV